MSNVKAGDIAFIVGEHHAHPESVNGALVEVLYAAPSGYFRLPDGQLASPSSPNTWVIKFQNPRTVRLSRSTRAALYAVCPDAWLRPIRADGLSAEEVNTLYAPSAPEKVSV